MRALRFNPKKWLWQNNPQNWWIKQNNKNYNLSDLIFLFKIVEHPRIESKDIKDIVNELTTNIVEYKEVGAIFDIENTDGNTYRAYHYEDYTEVFIAGTTELVLRLEGKHSVREIAILLKQRAVTE
mgnify:CR=1 FL=1